MKNASIGKLIRYAAPALIAACAYSRINTRDPSSRKQPAAQSRARRLLLCRRQDHVKIDGQTYIAGQMYVEFRIPAKQTHPYPIVMVHGGTRFGHQLDRHADGREGWAQYFVRRGYAVYVVDQPGRGRSGLRQGGLRPSRASPTPRARNGATCSRKSSSSGRRPSCTRNGPATASIDDPATLQIIGSFLPEIDFDKQQPISTRRCSRWPTSSGRSSC